MSGLARGGRRRRTATEEEEEVRVERTSESSEEMDEVEELASNRPLDSLIVISSVVETSTREGSAAEDLTASATTRAAAAAVGVVNAVRIVRRRVVTVGGRVDELIGEKATGRQVGGRETLSSNRLTLKQRKKGGVFLASRKPKLPPIKTFEARPYYDNISTLDLF